MAGTRRRRVVCRRCGWKGLAHREATRCARFREEGGYCWGVLRKAPKPKRKALDARERAERKRKAARRWADLWAARARTAIRAWGEWQRKADLYAKTAALTDAEMEALTAKRKAAAAKGKERRKVRAIELKGGV